jgi:hypothetical protein
VSSLRILGNYYKERYTLLPWVILPFYMAYIIADSRNVFFLAVLLFSTSLPFFRLFDDLFMSPLDIMNNKKHSYLNHLPCLKKMSLLPFSLCLLSVFSLLGSTATLLILAVVLVSIILYQVLSQSPFSLFISLLKYPVLGTLCTNYTITSWIIYLSLAFLCSELLEEKIIPNSLSSRSTYLLFFFLLILKIIWSNK